MHVGTGLSSPAVGTPAGLLPQITASPASHLGSEPAVGQPWQMAASDSIAQTPHEAAIAAMLSANGGRRIPPGVPAS